MNEQQLEQRIILNSYQREKERIVDKHPELADLSNYIDIEALKLTNQETATHGRVVSGPRRVAREAAEIVRKNFKKKTGKESTNDHGGMSKEEYMRFFTWEPNGR